MPPTRNARVRKYPLRKKQNQSNPPSTSSQPAPNQPLPTPDQTQPAPNQPLSAPNPPVPSQPIAGAAAPPTSLPPDMVAQIAAAVKQAMTESLQASRSAEPTAVPTQLSEVPVVAVNQSEGDSIVQGPIASALQHVSGETFTTYSHGQCAGIVN